MLQPIPVFYDSINRNAITIIPKKPFFDWLNAIDPKSPITEVEEDTIYLVRERDTNEDTEKWLKRNFDKIFQNELNDWYTDEQRWPQKRTFILFQEWFEYKICSLILDLEATRVTKD